MEPKFKDELFEIIKQNLGRTQTTTEINLLINKYNNKVNESVTEYRDKVTVNTALKILGFVK